MKLSLIYGMPFINWVKLLWENKFAVHPGYINRALLFTISSLHNSISGLHENIKFNSLIHNTRISEPPIFILGHWRSGTSHLQTLLSMDPNLSTPNMFQTLFPYSFLGQEQKLTRRLGNFIPPTRPEDNMRLDFQVPGEDEIALANISLKSLYLMWTFPDNIRHYKRYIDFKSVSKKEIESWKTAYMFFLKKLTLKYNHRLILKSPANTARIRILLEMFPEAYFIHIHRNPYSVFQSMRNLVLTWRKKHALLQQGNFTEIEETILNIYKAMYDVYFKEVKLVPQNRFAELKFEDFEENPIREIGKIYNKFNLNGFNETKEKIANYLESVSDYKKNSFPALDPGLKQRIAREWHSAFDAWDYKK